MSVATATGCRAGPVGKTPTSLTTRSTRPGLPGRSGRGTASAVPGSSGGGFVGEGRLGWLLRLPDPATGPRVFQPVPEPHVRDRLKHAGRHEEGQIVKAVRNGEDGATAGVEARNEEFGATGYGHQFIPSGMCCRRTPRSDRHLTGLPGGGRWGRIGNAAVRYLIAGTKNATDAGGREDGSSEPTAWTLAEEEFAVQHW